MCGGNAPALQPNWLRFVHDNDKARATNQVYTLLIERAQF
jgi:hypothetical protein